MKSKGKQVLFDLARDTIKREYDVINSETKLHFGIRFLSDKMLEEKISQGKSIGQSLKELAEEDYKSL